MDIHWIDLSIFIIYLLAMLGVGVFFMNKNKSKDDYYVGRSEISRQGMWGFPWLPQMWAVVSRSDWAVWAL